MACLAGQVGCRIVTLQHSQQNGFGTLAFSYPVNGIQNGSPDGIALVDPGSGVVHFPSYEGTFVAVGGPAGGLTSSEQHVRPIAAVSTTGSPGTRRRARRRL
jgi:hypothetical protein